MPTYITGDGDDVVTASDRNDLIKTNGGRDEIRARRGNDVVYAGDGDDVVDGGDGRDVIYGEAGNDELLGGAGDDTIRGGADSDTLSGGNDDDDVDGGSGSDVVDGGSGNDRLFGGSDFDVITTGTGTDLVYGGSGADFIDASGGSSGDRIYGDGYESLDDFLAGNPVTTDFGNDTIGGSDGNDTIYGDSGLDGVGGGADSLFGGAGKDKLYGEGGDDYLEGGEGNDTLRGGHGDDILVGGAGADVLTGGAGLDRFYVLEASDSSPSASDRITDFARGEDRIDLRALAGTKLAWGATTPTAQGVWYAHASGQTRVFVSLNGDQVPEMRFVLDGIHNLAPTDFWGVVGDSGPPSLEEDVVLVAEDGVPETTGNVLTNDVGEVGLEVTAVSSGATTVMPGDLLQGQYGSLVLNASGSFTYTLDNSSAAVQALGNGELASDVFAYTATDVVGSSTANLTMSISGINDAPTAAAASVVTNENTPVGGTLPAATDVENDAVTYGLRSQASHGTAVVNADGSFSYTPNTGFSGEDSFTFVVSDGWDDNEYSVGVTVVNVNEAPFVANYGVPAAIVRTPIGSGTSNDQAGGMVIQPDGKILLAGQSSSPATGGDFSLARYNADGTFDTTFGTAGVVITPVGFSLTTDAGTSIALQSDGKIVVAGRSGGDFAAVRYNADGTLDTTFGGDGIVTTAVGAGLAQDSAFHLAVQNDGKIVLVGSTFPAPVFPAPPSLQSDTAVVRYNADGSLDTTFGNGGIVITAVSPTAPDSAQAVLSQLDGGIIVAGAASTGTTGDDVALLRYTATGSLDTTFGGDGIVTTPIAPSSDFARAILQQPDGRIVIAGPAGGDFALARYNVDGTLDTTFGGGDGIVTTTITATSSDTAASVARQADGKLLVAGTTSGDFAIVRYNADGSVDTTFGSNGIVVTNIGPGLVSDIAVAISVLADGRIVVGGHTLASNFDFALTRYNADGSLDATFRAEERLLANEGSSFTYTVPADRFADPDDVILTFSAAQSDGSALPGWLTFDAATRTFSGTAPTGSADAHVRVTATDLGGLSASYAYWIYTNSAPTAAAASGIVTTNASTATGIDQAQAVALQSDGKILLAGVALNFTSGLDTTVARYNADGSLDLTFGGGDGIAYINTNSGTVTGPSTDTGRGMVVQPDGRIVVVSTTTTAAGGNDIAVSRLNANGTIDTSFGGGDGVVTTALGPGVINDAGVGVTLQADGKILVTGSMTGASLETVLLRYNTDGSLDTTFHTDGVAELLGFFMDPDEGFSVKTQADGKIVVSGYGPTPGGTAFLLARFNVDGSLDHSFGVNGIVTTDVGTGATVSAFPENGQGVAILPDGRILVVGHAPNAVSGLDIALVRYSSNGSLDTTFGMGGIVLTAAGTGADLAFGVALQPDGRIVVAGGAVTNTGGADIAVLRYNADGTLDTTFGGDGIVTTAVSDGLGTDIALSVAIQPDGHIVVGGSSFGPNGNPTDFTLVRYNGDGSLDTTLGGLGNPTVEIGKPFAWTVPPRAFTDADNDALIYTITMADGSPLPAWLTFTGLTLSGTPPVGTADLSLRLRATDSWGASATQVLGLNVEDPNDAPIVQSYGVPAGIVTTPIGSGSSVDTAGGMVIQPNGKILLVGFSTSPAGAQDVSLARYNADGTFDTTFGNGGIVITPIGGPQPTGDIGTSVAVQPDGKILVGGWTNIGSGADFALLRYNANGTLDTTFGGGDGIAITAVSPGLANDQALHLAVQSDGKIVLVGFTQPTGASPLGPQDIALARYNADGSIDTPFGTGGVVITPAAPGTGPDSARAVLLQSDGRILVAGSVFFTATGDDFALLRYTSTGVLDTTFGGGDGIVTTAIVPFADSARSILQQPDGRIVIVGSASTTSGGDFALARYNADGTLDSTFGTGGIVTTSIPGVISTDTGASVARQADGKLLVGGFTNANGGNDFAFVRYNTNGTVDTLFGSNGVVITNIGTTPPFLGGPQQPSQDTVVTIAVQGDGKIVLGGHASAATGSHFDFAIARYNSNGTLDTAFRAEERLTANEGTAFSHTVPANRFADPDGDVLTLTATKTDGSALPAWLTFDAATRTLSGTAPAGSADVHVRVTATDPAGLSASYAYWIYTNARPTAADPSGIVTTSLPTALTNFPDQANAVVLQPDGKFLVAGFAGGSNATTDTMVARYNADGSLDLTFGGGDGIATINVNSSTSGGADTGRGIVVLPDGKILVAGIATTPISGNDIAITRLNADGTLDSSFGGGDGILTTPIAAGTGNDAGAGITLQADGKIIVVGTTNVGPTSEIAVVRYNGDGSLDTTFDGDGFAIAGVSALTDEGLSVKMQPDGKIVISGYASIAGDAAFLVARFNADGSRDNTFGTNGIVTTNVGVGPSPFPESAQSIVIQPDGRIVAVGWAPTPTSPTDFAVVRYTSTGALDTTFGTGGIVRTAPGIALDFAFGVALQPDGRIVVGGGTFTASGGPDVAVLRYNADGSLDTTFGGGDGIVTTAIGPGGTQDAGLSLILQADGRIVIAGIGTPPTGGLPDFALVRYNADGTLDTTFGGIGNPTIEIGKPFFWTIPAQVFTDADNDALTFTITMTNGTPLPAWLTYDALTRSLTGTPPNGTADLALRVTATDPWGAAASKDFVLDVVDVNDAPVVNHAVPAGIVVAPIGTGNSSDLAPGMVVQPDGKIVLAGQSSATETSQDFTVVRYNADGSFDTTFGGDGIVVTPLAAGSGTDIANSVALQSDGKLVVAGLNGSDFAVARYNVDGSLDATFGGGNGIVTTAVGPSPFARDEALSVTVQSDGKIVVVGYAQTAAGFPPPPLTQSADIAVVRYNADGSLDTTFGGGDGVLTTQIGAGVLADAAHDVLVQSDGGIVVAGYTALTSIPNMITDFALVRYTASGALDPTFGGDGIVTTAIGPADFADQARSILQQPDGRIVVVGFSGPAIGGSDFVLARYNTDGSLDATFGTGGIFVHSIGAGLDQATGVVRQADGKLLVTGRGTSDFVIARYNANGTVDTTFGTDGIITTSVAPGGATAIGIALQPDGKIVVNGQAVTAINGLIDFALVRYDADGTLDATFRAEERVAATEGSPFSYTIPTVRFVDPDGDALAFSAAQTNGSALPSWLSFDAATRTFSGTAPAGSGDIHVRVTATDPDGLSASNVYWIYTNAAPQVVPPSGFVSTSFTNLLGFTSSPDIANAVALQPDGKILLTGSMLATPDTPVVRYNADGSLDLRFSNDGILQLNTNNAGGADSGRAIAVQPDGRILVASNSGSDIAVTRLNADGISLDGSFGGGDGIAHTNIPGGTVDTVQSMTLQADGKIVVAGRTTVGTENQLVVVRYNADGSLDTTFDTDGIAIAAVATDADEGLSVKTQADGKVVVSGYSTAPTTLEQSILVARFATNGSLDASFDGDGIVTTNIGLGTGTSPLLLPGLINSEAGQSLAIQPDGRIVVAGYGPTPTGGTDIALVRYNTDGSPDATFGTGGVVTTAVSASPLVDRAFGVALQTDGRIVVAGAVVTAEGGGDVAVLRYNSDGTLDATFGGDGIVTVAIAAGQLTDQAAAIAIQSDGRIVVAGSTLFALNNGTNLDFTAVRLNADGSLDTTFGGIGSPIVNAGESFSWTVQRFFTDADSDNLTYSMTMTDGSALPAWATFNGTALSGIAPPGSADLALRLTATDPWGASATQDFVLRVETENTAPFVANYGVPAGIVLTPVGLGNSSELAGGIVVQPDGKIVTAGTSTAPGTFQDFALVRHNADGSLDTTFGAGGMAITPFSTASDVANSVALQQDGKIVAAGWGSGTGASDFMIVRYNVDGSFDTTFGGGDGIVTTAIGPGIARDEALRVTVQADGRIVVVGYAQNTTNFQIPPTTSFADIAVARYNADGSPDSTFSGDGVLTTEIGTGQTGLDVASAVLVQADGGILVGGYATPTTTQGQDFALLRYRADGVLDPAFGGGDGIVTTLVAPGFSNDLARSMLQQPDGRIVLVGTTSTPTTAPDFAIARFNPDGSLDTTFGQNGLVTHSLTSGGDSAIGVVRQADGKLLVGGWTFGGFAIARYNVNGSLDLTFGTNGVVTTSVAQSAQAVGMAVTPDGKIVLGGHGSSANSPGDFVLARYNADGSLDATFRAEERVAATEGRAFSYSVPGNRFADPDGDALTYSAAQSDGSALPGWLFFEPATRALSGTAPTGSPDVHVRVTAEDPAGLSASYAYWIYTNSAPTALAPSGIVTTSVTVTESAAAVALQDGKIVLTGTGLLLTQDTPALRYNMDGSLDLTFSGDGITAINTNSAPPIGSEQGRAIAVQSDGRIVVASNSGNDIALSRLTAAGVLDASFGGGDGIVQNSFAAGIDAVASVALQNDGKILVAGRTVDATRGDNELMLVRYNADGSLDGSFGGGGIAVPGFGANADEALSVKIQADGKIVVSGYTTISIEPLEQAILVARFNLDGTLDTTFGTGGSVTTDIGSGTGLPPLPFSIPGFISEAGHSLVIQPDGQILVVGYAPTAAGGTDIALVRYNPDGSLDTSFGAGGIVTTSASPGVAADRGLGVALQADGRIVVGGAVATAATGGDFAALRYNSDGSLDTTFGGDGIVTVAVGTGTSIDQLNGVTIQPDGRIVLVGSTLLGASGSDVAAVRLNPDGSLDTSFGGIGAPVVNAGQPFSWSVQRFFVDADGDNLTYTVSMADGSPLPPGFTASPVGFGGFALTGMAPFGTGNLALRLTATDPAGASASQYFVLRVDDASAPPDDGDTFAFSDGFGAAMVTGFTAGDASSDVLDLSTMTNPDWTDFAQIAARTTDGDAGALIDLGNGNSITLLGVTKSSLTADDFDL